MAGIADYIKAVGITGAGDPNIGGLPPIEQQQIRDFYAGGSGGGAGDRSPAGLAAVFKQPNVTLPRSAEAMDALRNLQLSGVSGLERLLQTDPTANRERIAKSIYDNAAEGINFEADRQSQAVKEGQNAKNMLYSSGTSYFLDPIERGRSIGLGRASNDAYVQAGQEGRADFNTQMTALGQAFSQGTTGLQGEAAVEAANRTANQNATQAGYTQGLQLEENAANRGQQESQFTRNLSQTRDLTNQALQNQRDIASSAAVGAGISGGLSGLASLFGPSINRAIQRL